MTKALIPLRGSRLQAAALQARSFRLLKTVVTTALAGLFACAAAASTPASGNAGSAQAKAVAETQVNPFAGNESAIAVGKELYFRFGCNVCHGGGGGGGMGPSISNSDWVYGSDDATLFKLVKYGSAGLNLPRQGEFRFRDMPMIAYECRMTDEEIWKTLAFIRTLYRGE